MLLTEVLALVMGLAVLVMCLSQVRPLARFPAQFRCPCLTSARCLATQLHLVARNQTNVESNDNGASLFRLALAPNTDD